MSGSVKEEVQKVANEAAKELSDEIKTADMENVQKEMDNVVSELKSVSADAEYVRMKQAKSDEILREVQTKATSSRDMLRYLVEKMAGSDGKVVQAMRYVIKQLKNASKLHLTLISKLIGYGILPSGSLLKDFNNQVIFVGGARVDLSPLFLSMLATRAQKNFLVKRGSEVTEPTDLQSLFYRDADRFFESKLINRLMDDSATAYKVLLANVKFIVTDDGTTVTNELPISPDAVKAALQTVGTVTVLEDAAYVTFTPSASKSATIQEAVESEISTAFDMATLATLGGFVATKGVNGLLSAAYAVVGPDVINFFRNNKRDGMLNLGK
jgi:hypothetical protein